MALPSDVFISPGGEFGVISKLGEGTFNSIIQVIYEDVEQHGAQYHSLGGQTCDGLPA